MLLKPTALSASPGIGRFRETDPSATISWSYGRSTDSPSTETNSSVLRSGSQPATSDQELRVFELLAYWHIGTQHGFNQSTPVRRRGRDSAQTAADASAQARITCRPSDGWTSTQPWPERPSWKLSPEPSPISDLA
jgi:hypothetical protein